MSGLVLQLKNVVLSKEMMALIILKYNSFHIKRIMKFPTQTILWWLLVIAIIATPRLTNLNVFYARDELTIWSWSDQFSQAIWQGDLAGTLTMSDYPGIPMFWAQTAFLTFKYQFPALFPDTFIPVEQLTQARSLAFLAERRAVAGLLGTIQLLLVVGLLRQPLGQGGALAAAIFLGLDPFTLTEARLFRLESVSANFICLSLLTYFRFRQQARLRWLIFSGVMAGWAISSKTSAGLVVPAMVLLWLWESWQRQSKPFNFVNPLNNSLVWGGSAILAFGLIWPAMWIQPINALQHLFTRGLTQVSEESVWHGDVFFWGQLFDQDPGPFFYPVVLAFRTTPLMWLGLLAALWLLMRHRQAPQRELIGGLLLYAMLITLELTLILSKVDRFLLIIFPALSIIAAWGVARLPTNHRLLSLITLLVAQLIFTLPAHPYYFTYWNPLLGGGRVAMNSLPMGSGEGLDLAMNYLNQQPNAAQKTLVCGGSQPWCERIFKGTTLRSATYGDGSWFAADYASLYISHVQRQTYPPAVVNFLMAQKPLYQADLQGATYAWLYQVPQVDYVAPPETDLTGLGRLLGYSFNSQTIQRGQTLTMTIWWTNLGAGVENLRLRWVDNYDYGYEWGQALATPMPDYAHLPTDQPAILASQLHLTIPPETPPGDYQLRLGFTQSPIEFKLPEASSRLTVSNIAISQPMTLTVNDDQQTINQAMSSDLKLLAYIPSRQPLNVQSPIWLAFYWQASSSTTNQMVHLRLLNQSNQIVKEWEGIHTQGQYPPAAWQKGEIVKDVWALQADSTVPVGSYQLAVSLDDNDSIYRLPLEVWSQPINYDLPSMQVQQTTDFGSRLKLLGYDLFLDIQGDKKQLSPIFYWQSLTQFSQPFELELTLLVANTPVQSWRVPLAEGKTDWKAQEIVNTAYHFPVQIALNTAYNLEIALVESTQTHTLRLENIQNHLSVRLK